MEAIEDFFEIVFKNGFTIVLYLMILLAIPILGVGFFGILFAVIHYFQGEGDQNKLLFESLHFLEFFFIAPLPALIFFSFKDYIRSIFFNLERAEEAEKENEETTDSLKDHEERRSKAILNSINPEVAEKALVSSLTGVTSSFILSKLVESFGKDFLMDGPKIVTFAICFAFLTAQILYLKMLSTHESHK
ncbi:hypothetical protein ACFFGT_10445 [Mucilaginibacter angelicae]|uniref:Uncharacterized protein n=1 Tax=Mucilaginibacter angelicae TaxID=869718 RepID=A0ABV6L576_9SPHI